MPYQEYLSDLRICADIHQKYGKSFFAGTALFPQDLREATHMLYAFVRIPDEYVDTTYAHDPQEARIHLDRWQDAWHACLEDKSYEQGLDETEIAVLRAARYVFNTYKIPVQHSQEFLDVMRADITTHRYKTYTDLEAYMYGSASVVGIMMTYILCTHDSRFNTDERYRMEILGYAKTLGDAFQMTNFIRDIGEDYQDRGRIYLPQEDVEMYKVTEQMLAEKTVTSEIKMLIKFELERTDALYKRADKGIFMLPAFAGKGIYVARVLYSALHRKIMKQGYDTLNGRVRLSTLYKTWLIVRTLFTYRIQRWYATKRHHIFHE
ncbi:MAG: hypothetical protein RIQ72_627 [Candidatus Parcubacteria bacterium]|jgi:phytoene synthase